MYVPQADDKAVTQENTNSLDSKMQLQHNSRTKSTQAARVLFADDTQQKDRYTHAIRMLMQVKHNSS